MGKRDYTKRDFLAVASEIGLKASSRLIDEWVRQGLLDQPQRHGRGRGQGVSSTWSEEQFKLFRLLAGKRMKGVKRIATLCNIPVGFWLLFGDGYVPIRQVRRALRTWADSYRRVSWPAARITGNQVLDQLDHPDATDEDREELVELVAHAGYRGETDFQALAEVARRVFDPHNTGMTRGPHGLLSVETFIETLEIRIDGIGEIDRASDKEYLEARTFYANVGPTPGRSGLVPKTVLDRQPTLAVSHEEFEERVNSACLDLITTLGMLAKVPSGNPLSFNIGGAAQIED